MNPRSIFTYSCLFLYDPNIILFLKKILYLLNNPFLYHKFCYKSFNHILLHSYTTTRYYKEIFDDAELVHNVQINLNNFKRIPILTKEIIRKKNEDLKSSLRKRTFINTSGGSTGEPVELIQDKTYYSRMVADTILFSLLNGKHPGEKEIKLWGSERDIFEGTIGFKEKMINLIFNRIFLNSFKLKDKMIREYIDEIQREKPVQIWTYTDSILELAKYINKNSLNLFSPRNIICTAGTMYPEIRHEIQKAFPKSKVINQYGSREVGQIACQTQDNEAMIIFSHSNFVELIDPDTEEIITEPYKPGKVLVTNLNNYSMPLIRYDIGDVAEYGDIKMKTSDKPNRHFSKIYGRDNTHFINKNGERIHGEYFTHLFYNKLWVRNFQVIQNSPTLIDVLYIKNPEKVVDELDIKDMIEKMKLVLSNDINVNFIEVDSISKLKSGKYQFVRRNF